jgi:hypothetical protein
MPIMLSVVILNVVASIILIVRDFENTHQECYSLNVAVVTLKLLQKHFLLKIVFFKKEVGFLLSLRAQGKVSMKVEMTFQRYFLAFGHPFDCKIFWIFLAIF